MIPYARFAFDWPDGYGRFFDLVDPENSLYVDGTTLSESTVDKWCIFKVCNEDDELRLIDLTNKAIFQLRRTSGDNLFHSSK